MTEWEREREGRREGETTERDIVSGVLLYTAKIGFEDSLSV